MRNEELGAHGIITALIILKTIASRNKDTSFLPHFPGLVRESSPEQKLCQ